MRIGLLIRDRDLDEFVRSEISPFQAELISLEHAQAALSADLAIWFLEWPYGREVGTLLDSLRGYRDRQGAPPFVAFVSGRDMTAVSLLTRLGAADCLFVPPEPGEIPAEIEDLVVRPSRASLVDAGFDRIAGKYLIGISPAFVQALGDVRRASQSDANALIVGETGTGKEMVARTIHDASARARDPYIAVNCASLSPTVIESELFGHQKGSFTGAVKERAGRFEAAGNGTILLDEIGDLDLSLQMKLLRAVEQHEIVPVGANTARTFSARVLAATSVNLAQAIEGGKFRRDLYGRLNQIRIDLPPLRERRVDIPLLSRFFVRKHTNGGQVEISSSVMALLMQQDYPGNVRELENAMIRALSSCNGALLLPRHLPPELRMVSTHTDGPGTAGGLRIGFPENVGYEEARAEVVHAVDRHFLGTLLTRHSGNQSLAAKDAGIDRKTFAARWENCQERTADSSRGRSR